MYSQEQRECAYNMELPKAPVSINTTKSIQSYCFKFEQRHFYVQRLNKQSQAIRFGKESVNNTHLTKVLFWNFPQADFKGGEDPKK